MKDENPQTKTWYALYWWCGRRPVMEGWWNLNRKHYTALTHEREKNYKNAFYTERN